jgi:hypothetical protein
MGNTPTMPPRVQAAVITTPAVKTATTKVREKSFVQQSV